MANFTEKATLLVVDKSSAKIKKINRELAALFRTMKKVEGVKGGGGILTESASKIRDRTRATDQYARSLSKVVALQKQLSSARLDLNFRGAIADVDRLQTRIREVHRLGAKGIDFKIGSTGLAQVRKDIAAIAAMRGRTLNLRIATTGLAQARKDLASLQLMTERNRIANIRVALAGTTAVRKELAELYALTERVRTARVQVAVSGGVAVREELGKIAALTSQARTASVRVVATGGAAVRQELTQISELVARARTATVRVAASGSSAVRQELASISSLVDRTRTARVSVVATGFATVRKDLASIAALTTKTHTARVKVEIVGASVVKKTLEGLSALVARANTTARITIALTAPASSRITALSNALAGFKTATEGLGSRRFNLGATTTGDPTKIRALGDALRAYKRATVAMPNTLHSIGAVVVGDAPSINRIASAIANFRKHTDGLRENLTITLRVNVGATDAIKVNQLAAALERYNKAAGTAKVATVGVRTPAGRPDSGGAASVPSVGTGRSRQSIGGSIERGALHAGSYAGLGAAFGVFTAARAIVTAVNDAQRLDIAVGLTQSVADAFNNERIGRAIAGSVDRVSLNRARQITMEQFKAGVRGSNLETLATLVAEAEAAAKAQVPGSVAEDASQLANAFLNLANATDDLARSRELISGIMRGTVQLGAEFVGTTQKAALRQSTFAQTFDERGLIAFMLAVEQTGRFAGTRARRLKQELTATIGVADNIQNALTEAGLRDAQGNIADDKMFRQNPVEWLLKHVPAALERRGVDASDPLAVGGGVQDLGFSAPISDFVTSIVTAKDEFERNLGQAMEFVTDPQKIAAAAANNLALAFDNLGKQIETFSTVVLKPAFEAVAPFVNDLAKFIQAIALDEGPNGNLNRLAVAAGAAAAAISAFVGVVVFAKLLGRSADAILRGVGLGGGAAGAAGGAAGAVAAGAAAGALKKISVAQMAVTGMTVFGLLNLDREQTRENAKSFNDWLDEKIGWSALLDAIHDRPVRRPSSPSEAMGIGAVGAEAQVKAKADRMLQEILDKRRSPGTTRGVVPVKVVAVSPRPGEGGGLSGASGMYGAGATGRDEIIRQLSVLKAKQIAGQAPMTGDASIATFAEEMDASIAATKTMFDVAFDTGSAKIVQGVDTASDIFSGALMGIAPGVGAAIGDAFVARANNTMVQMNVNTNGQQTPTGNLGSSQPIE